MLCHQSHYTKHTLNVEVGAGACAVMISKQNITGEWRAMKARQKTVWGLGNDEQIKPDGRRLTKIATHKLKEGMDEEYEWQMKIRRLRSGYTRDEGGTKR